MDFASFRSLFSLWSYRELILLSLLALGLVFASFLEVLSIGAIIPIVGLMFGGGEGADSDKIAVLDFLTDWLLLEENSLSGTLVGVFISLILLASVFRIVLFWAVSRFAQYTGVLVNTGILKATVNRDNIPELEGVSGGALISSISAKTNMVVNQLVLPTLNIIAGIVICLFVIGFLISLDPFFAVVAALTFGSAYLGIGYFSRKYLKDNAKTINAKTESLVDNLHAAAFGLRDLRFFGGLDFVEKEFREDAEALAKCHSSNQVLGSSPKILVEALGICVVVVAAVVATQGPQGFVTAQISVIGAFGLAAQRLLPLFQQIYGGLAAMRGGADAIRSNLHLASLGYQLAGNRVGGLARGGFNALVIKDPEVRLTSNSSLKYKADVMVERGEIIGITGPSGVGKSSLFEALAGLQPLMSGSVTTTTSKNKDIGQPLNSAECAYIAQSGYLMNKSVADNVFFGKDSEVQKRKLDDYLSELDFSPEEHSLSLSDYIVESHGANLSGGQKQKVLLSRLFFSDKKLVLIDEGLAGLDRNSKEIVFNMIRKTNMQKIYLIISHDPFELKRCDRIININKERNLEWITKIGSVIQDH